MLQTLLPTFGTRIKSLEILALLNGIKPAVRHGYYDEELEVVRDFCIKNSLCVEISDIKIKILDRKKNFSNKGIIAKENEKGMRFVYISKDEYIAVKSHYYEFVHDHRNLGKFLGYPDCCIDFFDRNFDRDSDLNLHFIKKAQDNSKEFLYYNNILNRENDYAQIFHFPCRFDCKKSAEIGKQNLDLLDEKTRAEFENNLKGKFRVGRKTLDFG